MTGFRQDRRGHHLSESGEGIAALQKRLRFLRDCLNGLTLGLGGTPRPREEKLQVLEGEIDDRLPAGPPRPPPIRKRRRDRRTPKASPVFTRLPKWAHARAWWHAAPA